MNFDYSIYDMEEKDKKVAIDNVAKELNGILFRYKIDTEYIKDILALLSYDKKQYDPFILINNFDEIFDKDIKYFTRVNNFRKNLNKIYNQIKELHNDKIKAIENEKMIIKDLFRWINKNNIKLHCVNNKVIGLYYKDTYNYGSNYTFYIEFETNTITFYGIFNKRTFGVIDEFITLNDYLNTYILFLDGDLAFISYLKNYYIKKDNENDIKSYFQFMKSNIQRLYRFRTFTAEYNNFNDKVISYLNEYNEQSIKQNLINIINDESE